MYTLEARQEHLKSINNVLTYDTEERQKGNCALCKAKFKKTFFFAGMYNNMHYCEFCCNYVCTNCID